MDRLIGLTSRAQLSRGRVSRAQETPRAGFNFTGAKMVKVEEIIIEKCRKVVSGFLDSPNKSWVLFKHQTFVILDDCELTKESASEKATKIMKDFGPVCGGTPAADFSVIKDKETKGWIVTGDCKQMFTYVDEEEAKKQNGTMVIGLFGRGMRHQDGKNPEVVHIELGK